MNETTRPTYERHSGSGFSLGTILFGLILLSLGVLWLLDVADVIDFTWTFVGAVALVLVGVALIVGAREGSHGGLIFLGIVLTLVVLFGTLVSWPTFGGGVGERTIAPGSITELEESYRWGVGSQTIDLRDVDFPDGQTSADIQLGTGQVNVRVPDDVGVEVQWQVGVGNVEVLERQQSGFGLEGNHRSDGFDEAERQLLINVQVGMGVIEVSE